MGKGGSVRGVAMPRSELIMLSIDRARTWKRVMRWSRIPDQVVAEAINSRENLRRPR